MVDSGLQSRLWVARKQSDDPTVTAHDGLPFTIASELDRRLWKLQSSPTQTWRSPARFGTLSAKQINDSDADVVNLHWVTDGFLSIAEIGKITKPIVWSMYDMWVFCGTEHYGVDAADARWRSGYTKANRPETDHGFDLDRWTYRRKTQHWPPMHLAPASTWLTQATLHSALAGKWPITRIPHVIDTEAMAPIDKAQARSALDLPQDIPLVVFLASAGISDQRKGWDLLEAAVGQLRSGFPEVEVVVVGPPEAGYVNPHGTHMHWPGVASDTQTLRNLYAAADVVAVPSREDNMPLTAMEAHACGRPVVAFNIGGLPDIVEHHVTGYLAELGDIEQLAEGLKQAIEDSQHENRWGQAARAKALQTWSPQAVVPQYEQLYEQVRS